MDILAGDIIIDRTGGEAGAHAAERYAQRIDRGGSGAAARLEIVGDDGLGRRGAPSFADADEQTADKHAGEADGQTAHHGHQAPDREGYHDDHHPAGLLRNARNRNAQRRVEGRKGEPAEQAHLPVFQLERVADRIGQDAEDRPVDEIEDIDHKERAENVGAIALRLVSGLVSGLFAGGSRGGGRVCHSTCVFPSLGFRCPCPRSGHRDCTCLS